MTLRRRYGLLPVLLLATLPGAAPAGQAEYEKELLSILATTRSTDAFCVTLGLLGETKVDPREAIPVVIRNAERLGIFADSLQRDSMSGMGESVCKVLEKLSQRMRAEEQTPAPTCENPPDEAAILRALPPTSSVPCCYEERRDNAQVVVELIEHCRWKCTVYSDHVVESAFPFPFRWVVPGVEVVYLNTDCLRQEEAP
jgi:hypothetical protein